MKRSEINNYIKEAEGILNSNNFLLPPWAAWSLEDWKQNKQFCENIFESSLGWDLTDFGSGNYLNTGLLLVVFLTDGIKREVPAGGKFVLNPGESITLKTGIYHRFYAEEGGGTVIAGEVSMTNDDAKDNRFHDAPGRFPQIIEDEVPYRLLVGDYSKAMKNY